MTRRLQLIFLALCALTILLMGLIGYTSRQSIPTVAATVPELRWNSAQVISDTLTISDANTPAALQTLWHDVRQDGGGGWQSSTLTFTDTIHGIETSQEWRWLTIAGESDDVLLITASTAKGFAALTELARVFTAEKPTHTLVLLASDGSRYGAQVFLARYANREKIRAVLALEPVANEAPQLLSGGWQTGYAPLWLRLQTQQAVAMLDTRAEDAATSADAFGFTEFTRRAFPFAETGSAMFAAANIPAITVRGQFDSAFTEAWVRTLQPDNAPSYYWRVTETEFLPGWAVDVLTLLVFAPLFFAVFALWRTKRPRWDELKQELFGVLGVLVALTDGYAIAFGLTRLGVLPYFDATPLLRDAVWRDINWVALVLVYGTIGGFGWYIFSRRGWGRLADMLRIPNRDVLLLMGLAGMVIFFWQINSFATVALLGAPALTWVWITPHESFKGRFLNLGLLVAGALPLLVAIYSWGQMFSPWSLLVGAAYGYFPLPMVLGVFAGLALAARLARLGWQTE